MVSFEADIKPTFTDIDVDHLIAARHLDLGDYNTVKVHAGENRSSDAMCRTFRDWQIQGCPP